MKKSGIVGFLFLGMLVIFSANGTAKMVSGKVESVDSATKKLVVQGVDAASGKTVNSEMWVKSGATLSGVMQTV